MGMRTIHRYQLPITDCPSLDMPAGAEVLPAPPGERNRGDQIELWARVDTDEPFETRSFRIVGTGNPMPGDCGSFVGTVITHAGALVWHVFEGGGS